MPTKYESASILVFVLASQGESKTSLWIYPHEMRIGKDMCPVIYIFLKNYYRSQSAAEYYSIGKRFNLRSEDHYLRVTLEKRIVTCAVVLAYYREHVQPTVKTQIRTS
jgi:hypothetical protein